MTRDEALKIYGKGVPPPLQSIDNFAFRDAKSFLEGYEQGVRDAIDRSFKHDGEHFGTPCYRCKARYDAMESLLEKKPEQGDSIPDRE